MTMASEDLQSRARIERYLGRVEAHLGELTEDDREEVLGDLSAHIHDAIARLAPEGPTEADVTAVLMEMDPPSSFGPAPRRAAPPPPPPPVASSFPVAETILLAVAIGVLLLTLLPIWSTDPSSGATPALGLVVFALLLGIAAVVACGRWLRRTTGLSPLVQKESVSAASFLLLVVCFSALLATLVAAATTPGYGSFGSRDTSGAEAVRLRLAEMAWRDLFGGVTVTMAFVAGAAFLLSIILGRVALSDTSGDVRLDGWPRARAMIAPALGAVGLLGGLAVLPLAVATLATQGSFRGSQEEFDLLQRALPYQGSFIAGFTLAGLLLLFGTGLLIAPAMVRFPFAPVLHRLKRRHAWWFYGAAVIVGILAGILLAVYLRIVG
jgi:hypothetical protein